MLAESPSDLIVSVYRSPYRNSGSIDLDSLEGFALVTERRLVHIPAGISRVRFEGARVRVLICATGTVTLLSLPFSSVVSILSSLSL